MLVQNNNRNKFTKVRTAKKRTESSAVWLRRQLNDPFVKQAQQQGYRSRAAFKIIEIDDKFKIFKKNNIVLDLGCAPGGWCQVAVKRVGDNKVLGVDLLEMPYIDGAYFLQQDFLAPDAPNIITDFISDKIGKNRKCNVILSDMATNTCGESRTDHLRIVGLLEETLDFSFKVLEKDGVFVGKIFQGGASGELLKTFRDNFKIVKHFKPESSRKDSKENYIVAMGFKGQNLD